MPHVLHGTRIQSKIFGKTKTAGRAYREEHGEARGVQNDSRETGLADGEQAVRRRREIGRRAQDKLEREEIGAHGIGPARGVVAEAGLAQDAEDADTAQSLERWLI